MDINTKKLKKNAFRITKTRGITASRVRVPGGHLKAEYLGLIQEIADKYGNGTVHITTRQGFEIPGISFKDMDAVIIAVAHEEFLKLTKDDIKGFFNANNKVKVLADIKGLLNRKEYEEEFSYWRL